MSINVTKRKSVVYCLALTQTEGKEHAIIAITELQVACQACQCAPALLK